MWNTKYNGSAELNKESQVTPLCLKVSARVPCPCWGTTLQEQCGPIGNSPGNSDNRAQKHNLRGKAKITRLVYNKVRTKRRCNNINASRKWLLQKEEGNKLFSILTVDRTRKMDCSGGLQMDAALDFQCSSGLNLWETIWSSGKEGNQWLQLSCTSAVHTCKTNVISPEQRMSLRLEGMMTIRPAVGRNKMFVWTICICCFS